MSDAMDPAPMHERPEVRKHSSMTVRVLLVIAGSLALVLAVIGIFTPVLPTTPFVLLAAACYARASDRFHDRLLANRTFGPLIREWQQYRSIPRRTKLLAISMMAGTLTISIVFFVQPPWLKGALAVFGAFLAFRMYRIPSRDAQPRTAGGAEAPR